MVVCFLWGLHHTILTMQKIETLETLGIAASDRILAVFPHPDDESVYAGGLVHLLAKNNQLVNLTVLTKGEKSTLRNGLSADDPLAEVRAKEFYRAADILGVVDRQLGDFHDGLLSQETVELGQFLQKQVELLNPTIVLTLEPSGIYGHPDHIAVSLTVTHVAKENNLKVLYVTVQGELYNPSAASRQMADVGHVFEPLTPDFQLLMTKEVAAIKLQAIVAHASQHRVDQEFIDKWGKQRQLLNSEFYTFAK